MRWVSKGVHLSIKFFVLMGAALSVLPLVFLIGGAFMGESELEQIAAPVISGGSGYASWHFIPLYPTFKNIIELLFDTPEYYVLFWNSVKIVGVILIGQLVFAVPAAWGLARSRNRLSKIIFGLYMFCMILPFQVTMLSQYLVLNRLNMINTHWAVILPFVFSTFPIFIMYSAFEQVPDSVVEAARLDGAGGFKVFIYMAVPIAKRGVLVLEYRGAAGGIFKGQISVAIIGISAGYDWGKCRKSICICSVQLYSFSYHILYRKRYSGRGHIHRICG